MKAVPGCILTTVIAVLLAGCGTSTANSAEHSKAQAASASVAASARTQPVSGETESVVIALGDSAVHTRLIAATKHAGLAAYGLDGKPVASNKNLAASLVAISYGYPMDGQATTLLATIGAQDNRLHVFTLRNGKPVATEAGSAALGLSAEGLCLFRDRIDNHLYALITGKGGQIDQKVIYTNAKGKLAVREVRRIHFPTELKQCVADDSGHVYVAQESTGIWRFNGNPESDLDVALVDASKFGHIHGKTGGLAIYDGGKDSHWLLASLPSAGRINVYDIDHDDAFIGSFAIARSAGGATLEEPGPLAATSMAQGKAFPHGLLVVGADDDTDYHLVSMADVASVLDRPAGTPQDPRHILKSKVATVMPLVETQPVANPGDAADDPAIWANPKDPAASLVIGTDKKAGMYVYDMQGQITDFRPDGNMNNTDLREGFDLGGKDSILVTASDRSHDAIAIYRLDPATRKLENVADGLQKANLGDPYGLCMYQSPDDGKTYVFVNTGSGLTRQWQLLAGDHDRVHAHKVRDFHFDSQVEGCVADDPDRSLYVDEEDVAIWKLGADPDAGAKMTAIDRISDNPALRADLEGIGIYPLGHGRGYIVASVQGNDTYAVYRLGGDHAYLGSFAVVADPVRGIDGISQTDGLEVTSRNLGPGFEHGAMIAQDGRNVMPQENQNFKYVSWDAIARALHLEVRSTP